MNWTEFALYAYFMFAGTSFLLLTIDVCICVWYKKRWEKKDTVGTFVLLVFTFIPVLQLASIIAISDDIKKEIRS